MNSATGAAETVGMIGLGMMGRGIAKNIVEKGYGLTILARSDRLPVDDLVGRGAVEVATARDVAARSSVVFVCVTGSAEVERIVRAPDGLKAGLKPGAVVVDCSTSSPESTLALAAELAALSVDYADAPLARTPTEAWAGELDTMVGASDAVFARLRPVIGTWASRATHIGAVGDGHRMKLLNNFLSLGYGALYAEALTLAGKVGISPQRFDSVIRGGRSDSGIYQMFMSWVLDGDRDAHRFTIGNAFKDLRYLEAMADAAGVANPIGNAVKNSFGRAVAAGGAGDFVPTIAGYTARLSGADLEPEPR